MKGPLFMKRIMVLTAYPIMYYVWVQQMKNSWIQNDLKDLHPQILFPEVNRFKRFNSPYPVQKQFQQCLVSEANGLRETFQNKIKLQRIIERAPTKDKI